MRKAVLFIAMSLDGYIADKDGNVGWLGGQEMNQNDMVSYDEFIRDIGTVVMGWATYNQIAAELSPEEWMYKGLESYVLTHREIPSTDEIKFVNVNVCELISDLKKTASKDIWICGGANTAGPLIAENLIDKYYISVIPVILGSGIRLFGTQCCEIKLRLLETKSYNGITDLIYERR